MLQELSSPQISALAEYRQRWLDIGVETAPADRAAAKAGVDLAYQAAGLTPPGLVIWLGSPMAGAIGAAILAQARDQVGQVGDLVWDLVWARVGAQVRAQAWDQVGDQVRQVWVQVGQAGDQVGQIRDLVWAQVRTQVRHVWAQIRAQVAAQVWAQVGQAGTAIPTQVGTQVWAQVGRAGYGQHDANWLGFYEFLQVEAGMACIEPLQGIMTIAKSCGWWWPFQGAVILTERPCALHQDEQGRLHHPSEMAIRYPDGWGIHAWHGTRIPARYYECKPTARSILAEPNDEVRRALIERME